MTPTDFTRYTQALAKAVALAEKIRNDPPNDPTEYLAALAELAALWNEVRTLAESGNLTPADIEAAHRQNQKVWGGEEVEPPQSTGALYDVEIEGEYPGDAEVIRRGYMPGRDYVHIAPADEPPPRWGMRRANLLPYGRNWTTYKLLH